LFSVRNNLINEKSNSERTNQMIYVALYFIIGLILTVVASVVLRVLAQRPEKNSSGSLMDRLAWYAEDIVDEPHNDFQEILFTTFLFWPIVLMVCFLSFAGYVITHKTKQLANYISPYNKETHK